MNYDLKYRGSMKRRSSRRRVVIERDEARFHLGETSSSEDEVNGNERRGNEGENTFAGVRDDLNLPLVSCVQDVITLIGYLCYLL